ncbi:MAG: hypothetical protein OEZ37_12780, partial [Gemmatimonadota bacterium]|nr:hypothetical protein [Gemmatimonadota bacterium]
MSTRVTPSILAPALTLALLLPPATGLAAQDLTLKEAVESAIESHPAMAGAGARVDGAEAALGMARARSIPDV